MKSLLLPLLLGSALHAADRPNIVFIFAEDWGRHASAYAALDGPGTANDILSTPNFDRLTSLINIAPTILDVAGVDIPAEMTGKSLLPVLTGKESPASTGEAVFTGRERHFVAARDGNLPYPQRAIRTKDHLFIINFKPDRWPAGDPRNLSPGKSPSENQLENNTRITLADEDAGPTKAFMVYNRENDTWARYYNRAYGKRPEYELYVLKNDPDHMEILSGKPGFGEIESDLKDRLMAELTRTNDPRVTGDRIFYETSPMTDGE